MMRSDFILGTTVASVYCLFGGLLGWWTDSYFPGLLAPIMSLLTTLLIAVKK